MRYAQRDGYAPAERQRRSARWAGLAGEAGPADLDEPDGDFADLAGVRPQAALRTANRMTRGNSGGHVLVERAVRKGQQPPWMVPDGLWERIEPLLPVVPRRSDHLGRRRLDDRKVLSGILFVLYTGIP
jgi:hypothetical protein